MKYSEILENKNIDYIEESEDEDDFENVSIDKHVNIYKTVPFECIYSENLKNGFLFPKLRKIIKLFILED